MRRTRAAPRAPEQTSTPPLSAARPPLAAALVAEAVGTFLLVFFGTGAVAAAVLTGAQVGLWQVAVVWGFGVTIAIYCSSEVSGAHLNPAVTLALALLWPSSFRRGWLFPYWGAQMAGAVAAGGVVWLTFRPFIARFEEAKGIVRGAPGSELSAMIFGEYFPNPAMFGTDAAAQVLVSPLGAALIEGLGTAVLVFVIFALTDPRNRAAPPAGLTPFFIGFTVAVLISLFAPLTQAGWNPARDFGPRLIAAVMGWGTVAIPGPGGGFWVYIVGPLVGGPLRGLVYDRLMGPALVPRLTQMARPATKGTCGARACAQTPESPHPRPLSHAGERGEGTSLPPGVGEGTEG